MNQMTIDLPRAITALTPLKIAYLMAFTLAMPVTTGCGDESGGESGVSASGGNGSGGGDSGGSGGSENPSSGSGGSWGSGEWQTLIDAEWTLSAASEGYYCARKTVDEDTYVASFQALSPIGTHHTVVTVQDPDGPDETFSCSPGTLSDIMVFTSGVGSDPVHFPDGVAMKIPAGKQVLLNLHLFNTSNEPLSNVSGTQIKVVDPALVEDEAEVVFAGTMAILLAPNSAGSASGSCTFKQDATLLSVWPHMHQYGTHMKVVHESSAGAVTLHDAAFNFNEQLNVPLDSVAITANESITVDCSYQNTSADVVTFGDSSEQEMCFAGLYRFPASGESLFCDLNL